LPRALRHGLAAVRAHRCVRARPLRPTHGRAPIPVRQRRLWLRPLQAPRNPEAPTRSTRRAGRLGPPTRSSPHRTDDSPITRAATTRTRRRSRWSFPSEACRPSRPWSINGSVNKWW